MARIQGATLSNKIIPKKRKRKASSPDDSDPQAESATDSPSSTSIVPTKTEDGGKKPRRTKASGAKPLTLRRKSSTNLVETTIPWPDHFKQLSQLHRALNLVYTFCCTRKHFATTFDTIKSAVEGNIKRPLVIEDVAQVKALIPRAITFAYVDENMLQVTMMGEGDGIRAGYADT